ncbi:MAG: M28 family peptidase [Paludibacteraceae bacterium]|nr:M28 family peptidase [Paludibacteraceae bacterium]
MHTHYSNHLWLLTILLLLPLTACTNKQAKTPIRPAFNADTAYMHISKQVSMGPRVPDTRAHTECLLYLLQQLNQYGAVTEIQKGQKTAYDGNEQQVINIIGHFGDAQANGRILLGAHYDSRPWCDEEEDYDDRYLAVPGANDGASGVGLLLEVARQLGLKADSLGRYTGRPIDIVFFDCEDMGAPNFYLGQEREDDWCLGSQLWAEEMALDKPMCSRLQYGIIVDMVGAHNATFPKEYNSVYYAKGYLEKIWYNAHKLGYSQYFLTEETYPITDDHLYINRITGIPCVDIIHYNHTSGTGFPDWWHTQQDDMTHISRETLQAVGETIMATIE